MSDLQRQSPDTQKQIDLERGKELLAACRNGNVENINELLDLFINAGPFGGGPANGQALLEKELGIGEGELHEFVQQSFALAQIQSEQKKVRESLGNQE
jgi:hypothetical protein